MIPNMYNVDNISGKSVSTIKDVGDLFDIKWTSVHVADLKNKGMRNPGFIMWNSITLVP